VTGSFWVRRFGSGSSNQVIYSTDRKSGGSTYNLRFRIEFNASNQLQIVGNDDTTTAGVTNLSVTTAATFTDYIWHHILFSLDLTNAAHRSIYIDDALDASTWGTYITTGQIAFNDHATNQNSAIGAVPDGSSPFQGDLSDFWMDIGVYTDFSVTANRRLFIDANHNPVYLGAAGATPTGTSPNVYLTGPTATWNVNQGTGGGFTTTHGVLSTAQSQPGAAQTGSITSVSTKTTGNTSSVQVRSGNYLYVMDAGNSKIEIVDVSNPASMSVTGSVSNAGLSADGAIALSGDGNTAYVCSAGNNGLLIFNVTNKASPAYVTTITGAGICTNSGVYALLASDAVVGNYLYVPAYTANTLSVFDITTPTSPVLKGQVTDATNLAGICCVVASGNYVYAIAPAAGIFTVVNVTNPASPSVVGHVQSNTLGTSRQVVNPANTNIVYSGGAAAMAIIDTTTKTAPVLADFIELEYNKRPCFTFSSDSAGRRLYCSAFSSGEDAGMDVYDITTPTAPLLLADKTGASGTICTNCSGTVSADGNYIFNASYYAGAVQSWLVSSCTGPNGWTGDVVYNAGSNHVLQYCDGAAWQPLGPVPGAGGGGCSGPAGSEGDTIYNSGKTVMQYCDGTSWIALGGAPAVGTTTGLAGWWKFDETSGSSASDSSGNGNTGTLVNAPAWTPGMDNGALQFTSSSNQYVDVGNASSLNFERTQSFSVAAWGYILPDFPNESYIISKRLAIGPFQGFGLAQNPGNNNLTAFLCGVADSSCAAGIQVYTPNGSLSLSTWHHVAMTYDGSSTAAGVHIYIDGVNQTLSVHADGLASSILNSNDMMVGVDAGFGGTYCSGTLDDVRIYNRVLSAAEVSSIYYATGGQ
jgi:hypothetical protein